MRDHQHWISRTRSVPQATQASPECENVTDPFLWGVWVSLSRKNFDRYVETYDAANTNDEYFDRLCNYLPYYPTTFALKTQVHPRAAGARPYVVLEKTDHPLSIDFHGGISIRPPDRLQVGFRS